MVPANDTPMATGTTLSKPRTAACTYMRARVCNEAKTHEKRTHDAAERDMHEGWVGMDGAMPRSIVTVFCESAASLAVKQATGTAGCNQGIVMSGRMSKNE